MAAFDPLTAAFQIGEKLLDRFFPDPVQKSAAALELAKMKESGELARLAADTDLMKGQLAINLEEAKVGQTLTSNLAKLWVAGWRPGVGWVCVVILALTYIPKALVLTLFWAYQTYLLFAHPDVKLPAMPPFPDLGVTDVLGIIGTLLGSAYIAKLRTDEKSAGVEHKR